jgi:hypothetical protein
MKPERNLRLQKRVRQLLDLDDELRIFDVLRLHTPSQRLYLVDRRLWIVQEIERLFDAGDEGKGQRPTDEGEISPATNLKLCFIRQDES